VGYKPMLLASFDAWNGEAFLEEPTDCPQSQEAFGPSAPSLPLIFFSLS
jgi:hypothetical protein